MKKSICSFLCICLLSQIGFAQQQWTWVGGSKQANINGSYGIMGVPSPNNSPGSRYGACTWTDAQGNFWLYGGSGSAESSSGLLNDLWRYNPSTNQWTWMSGDKAANVPGRYGILGIPVFQQPGARHNAAAWTDEQGNFWMFGGSGHADNSNTGLLNDLWKYTPSTSTWSWVGGSDNLNQEGEYGREREPDDDNLPGGRYLSTTWTDGDGNLWLFGGYGFSEREETGGLNDVWRYSISSQEWTWMNGEKREDRNGRYGLRGEFADNTTPGGREGATGWKDKQGRFWIYGGERGNNLHNDLWVYDPDQNQWAWMSGSEDENEEPEFDEIGEPTDDGHPGGRMLASGWVDPNGDLWMFGGMGYGRLNNPLNSIWKYTIDDETWTFVKGEASVNPSPVYGTKGSAAEGNRPAGLGGSSAWTHEDGTFWLFGGQFNNDYSNQTWHFSPCGSGSISPESAKICEGGSQELTVTGGSGYAWLRNNQVINGATSATYTATQTGTYSVLVKNGACEVAALNTVEISKATAPTGSITPATAKICQGASQVLTATGGTSYQWKHNGTILPETTASITVSQGGTYSVVITNGSCTGPASNTSEITVEPTPAGTITPASAAVCNGIGQTLTATGGTSYQWQLNGETIAGQTASTINVTIPGTYSVIVKGGVCEGAAANTAEVVELNNTGVRYEDISTQANVPVQLSARIAGESYEWLPFSGLDDPSSGTPTARIQSETQYTVRITNEQGCSVIDTQVVKVVPGNGGNSTLRVGVPSAFTPNANNINDRLRPLGNIVRLDYFRVYNRWGIMVYQTNVVGEGWDGKYKGELQQPGTYTWILVGRASDGQPLKLSGKTVLIR